MKALKIALIIGCISFCFPSLAQEFFTQAETAPEQTEQIRTWLDEFDPYAELNEHFPFDKKRISSQTIWQYPDIREADVAWMTRYERVIDTRQKMNILLRHPKLSLTKLMFSMALTGDFPMYSDRDFEKSMSKAELIDILVDTITVQIPDPEDPNFPIETRVPEAISLESIVKYRIMEDWIFDKKHSRLMPRIVAIAPMYKPVVANGSVELNEQPVFWMKYDDVRTSFSNADVFNKNLAARISMDHFFQARMFDSYIVKEPNEYDYDIKYFPEFENNPMGALLKSEEIKNNLFVLEHDLWEF